MAAIDFFAPARRRAGARARVAAVALLPITAVAVAHAFLDHTRAELEETVAATDRVTPRRAAIVQPATELAASSAAYQGAARIAAWLNVRWEPALRALERSLSPDISIQQIRIDAAGASMTTTGFSSDVASLHAFARTMREASAGSEVEVRRVGARRSGRGVEFELQLRWSP